MATCLPSKGSVACLQAARGARFTASSPISNPAEKYFRRAPSSFGPCPEAGPVLVGQGFFDGLLGFYDAQFGQSSWLIFMDLKDRRQMHNLEEVRNLFAHTTKLQHPPARSQLLQQADQQSKSAARKVLDVRQIKNQFQAALGSRVPIETLQRAVEFLFVSYQSALKLYNRRVTDNFDL